jgi:hypothetical protein
MFHIRSRQFKHAAHQEILVEPVRYLGIKHCHCTTPLARFRLFVYVFSQHPRDRVPVVTGKFCDLDIGPALVFQLVNR